jgi:hypothetical protein
LKRVTLLHPFSEAHEPAMDSPGHYGHFLGGNIDLSSGQSVLHAYRTKNDCLPQGDHSNLKLACDGQALNSS